MGFESLYWLPWLHQLKKTVKAEFIPITRGGMGLLYPAERYVEMYAMRPPADVRVENRIPGADVNPYYAYAATIAAGLAGIDAGLPSPELHEGNAWQDGALESMTTSLHRSVDRFATAAVALFNTLPAGQHFGLRGRGREQRKPGNRLKAR